ncbi:PREDICTED: uncharacterized protein LOC108620782 [Drosophila arizonae]|uniref:Uncharacterized protein LOC108620782 n=1 Tax=Drosophila arizonae TaxID=7263 RepID=A0ABM1Q178_DROAR|nr:PREDICTED: uncharacterized protein LOC108620782 [Drosophila arizonae]
MFNSLLSNRYNKKREMFYAQYEATRLRYSNLPVYQRPEEPLGSKSLKCARKKRKHADYDYDGWIAGHSVPIVVRRAIENWSCCQLMERVDSLSRDGCSSWRSWPTELDEALAEPRRSLRLADKPNLRLKQMSQPTLRDTIGSVNWQQQPTSCPAPDSSPNRKMNNQSSAEQLAPPTFIDGLPQLECSMCCKPFGHECDLQQHSLDDCRKYLLATLPNSNLS